MRPVREIPVMRVIDSTKTVRIPRIFAHQMKGAATPEPVVTIMSGFSSRRIFGARNRFLMRLGMLRTVGWAAQ